MTLAGVLCTLGGAAVITFYTVANYHFRSRGTAAAWWGGWILGSMGMMLKGAGWVLLALAGPHYDNATLRILGALVAAFGGVLYFSSAAYVGRVRSRQMFDLRLHTAGIYRLVRHPQALALCIVVVGIGLATLSRPYVLGLPLLAGYWIAYTYLEERFELLPAFGDEYREYIRYTGRLLPPFKRRRRLPSRPDTLPQN